MTRAAPQLNIFSIGFPLTLVMGMFIFWVGLADAVTTRHKRCSGCVN